MEMRRVNAEEAAVAEKSGEDGRPARQRAASHAFAEKPNAVITDDRVRY
jgi:hypothetical protein